RRRSDPPEATPGRGLWEHPPSGGGPLMKDGLSDGHSPDVAPSAGGRLSLGKTMQSSWPSIQELLFLPLHLRLAWGATVLERALADYSLYAREKYSHPVGIETAWAFAVQDVSYAEKRAGFNAAAAKFPEEDSEGYEPEFITVTFLLLGEID